MNSLSDMKAFVIFFLILLLGFTDVLFKLSVIGNKDVEGARPIKSWPEAMIVTY